MIHTHRLIIINPLWEGGLGVSREREREREREELVQSHHVPSSAEGQLARCSLIVASNVITLIYIKCLLT